MNTIDDIDDIVTKYHYYKNLISDAEYYNNSIPTHERHNTAIPDYERNRDKYYKNFLTHTKIQNLTDVYFFLNKHKLFSYDIEYHIIKDYDVVNTPYDSNIQSFISDYNNYENEKKTHQEITFNQYDIFINKFSKFFTDFNIDIFDSPKANFTYYLTHIRTINDLDDLNIKDIFLALIFFKSLLVYFEYTEKFDSKFLQMLPVYDYKRKINIIINLIIKNINENIIKLITYNSTKKTQSEPKIPKNELIQKQQLILKQNIGNIIDIKKLNSIENIENNNKLIQDIKNEYKIIKNKNNIINTEIDKVLKNHSNYANLKSCLDEYNTESTKYNILDFRLSKKNIDELERLFSEYNNWILTASNPMSIEISSVTK